MGILIPDRALDAVGWRRVYGAYLECERAGVHTRLLAAAHLADVDISSGIRGLLIPSLEFAERRTVECLNAFVAAGGAVLANAEACAAFDTQGLPHALSGAPFGVKHADASPGSQSFGRGTVTWVCGQPMGAGVGEQQVVWSAIDQGASRVDAWACSHRLPMHSWACSMRLADLAAAAKTCPPVSAWPRPEPDSTVQFRHYQYEHSSDWILPHESSSQEMNP